MVVLLIDVVESRWIADRAAFAQRFDDALARVNARHAAALVAPAVASKGIDEVSAVFSGAASLARFCLDLQVALHPVLLRFAAASGGLDVRLERPANEMDGPAFHAAARRIAEVEEAGSRFGCRLEDRSATAQAVVERLLDCCLGRVVEWPEAAARVARAHWFGAERQVELARELGITQQAVSAALARAGSAWLGETLDVLSAWFAEKDQDGCCGS